MIKLSNIVVNEYFVYSNCLYQLKAKGETSSVVVNFAGVELSMENDTQVRPCRTFTPNVEDDE